MSVPLVRPGDVDSFVREIDRFRRMSGEERAAIGSEGRALVKERFALPTMHDGYEKVYRELV